MSWDTARPAEYVSRVSQDTAGERDGLSPVWGDSSFLSFHPRSGHPPS